MKLPEEIQLCTDRDRLHLRYDDGEYVLTAEYLRVYSPSAEVRGHGAGQAKLQTGKRDVKIVNVHGVGNYALKLVFSDGHDSGLYHWDYLRELSVNQAAYWQQYLDQLAAAGASRDATLGGSCGGSCACRH